MKLISLNTWYCKKEEHVYEYIREHANSVDIFCIQEIMKGGKGKTTGGEPQNSYEI